MCGVLSMSEVFFIIMYCVFSLFFQLFCFFKSHFLRFFKGRIWVNICSTIISEREEKDSVLDSSASNYVSVKYLSIYLCIYLIIK